MITKDGDRLYYDGLEVILSPHLSDGTAVKVYAERGEVGPVNWFGEPLPKSLLVAYDVWRQLLAQSK